MGDVYSLFFVRAGDSIGCVDGFIGHATGGDNIELLFGHFWRFILLVTLRACVITILINLLL